MHTFFHQNLFQNFRVRIILRILCFMNKCYLKIVLNAIQNKTFRCNHGEQGWRSGESTRLPPMWPGFESWRRRHMWVEFVVGSLPCSERFFSGFPLSLKTNTFKFQFDLERTDTSQRVLMNSLVLRG